jgi:hypothetical protein
MSSLIFLDRYLLALLLVVLSSSVLSVPVGGLSRKRIWLCGIRACAGASLSYV